MQYVRPRALSTFFYILLYLFWYVVEPAFYNLDVAQGKR